MQHGERAFGLDDHTPSVVRYPAGHAERVGEPVDERPETDSLDRAAHPYAQARRCIGHAGCGASCCSRADNHSSTPAPVRAETRWIGTVGLTMRTPLSNAASSNSKTSARSYLLSATRSALANMPGYLYGLTWPSGTLAMTRFRSAPSR